MGLKCDELESYVCGGWCCSEESYHKNDVDEAIAELKAENKKLKASSEQIMNELFDKVLIYPHDMVSLEDAYKLAVSLKNTKRMLWMARAEMCHRFDVDIYLRKHCNSWHNENFLTFNEACIAMEVKMRKAESKCIKKAEEYK